MLLALLLFGLSILLGISIMSKIGFADNAIAKLAFSFPVGIASSGFILLALYFANGYFDNFVFYLALMAIAILSVVLLYPFRLTGFGLYGSRKGKDKIAFRKVIAISLVVYAIIAMVLIISIYMKNGTLYCVGPALCSDLMYHIGIGNSIVYTHFPPKYLFTIDTINVFPFISDFYSAVLMRYGMGLLLAVMLPYMLLFFSAVVGTALLSYRITKSPLAVAITLLVFWFGSDYAMAIMLYFLSSLNPAIPNFFPPLGTLLGNYGISATGFHAIFDSAELIASGWTSIIYQILMPQRDFVLGLPIGIMLIYAIYAFGFDRAHLSKTDFAFLGIMFGMLPLVHPVTMEVVAVVGAFGFAYLLTDRKKRKDALVGLLFVTIPAICLAVPQLTYMTHQRLASGWYRFVYQYFMPYTGNAFTSTLYGAVNIILYWIEMVGIPLLLAIVGLKLAPKKARMLFIPFLALWVFISVYAVQPLVADSNKVFLYVFLLLSILASYPVAWLYSNRKIFAKALAIVLVALVSMNFVFMYTHWATYPFHWITKADFNATDFILHNTSQDAIFAVSNNESLIQIVSSLGHRQTLISFEPYVTIDEHTYPMQQLDAANAQIFDYANCTTIKAYNISYIFYQSDNASGERVFENANFSLVYNTTDRENGDIIAIYKASCKDGN
ncbi:MAG: hypothetical protein ACP5RM_03300 [Candidatus Micrarchaeia archaeon]